MKHSCNVKFLLKIVLLIPKKQEQESLEEPPARRRRGFGDNVIAGFDECGAEGTV